MHRAFSLLAPELFQGCYRLRVIGQCRSQLLQAASQQPCSSQAPKFSLFFNQYAYRNEIGIALLGACIALCKRAEAGVAFVCEVDEIILYRVEPGRQ